MKVLITLVAVLAFAGCADPEDKNEVEYQPSGCAYMEGTGDQEAMDRAGC